MSAWNGWYHVIIGMYGTWLPGDVRGWRERDHKKHVPGDYRDPPPSGFGQALHTYSQDAMVHEVTRLSASQRPGVGRRLVEKFRERGFEVLCVSVGSEHVHVLAKFPESHRVKIEVGHAKRAAALSFEGAGKLWSKGCAVKPITGRAHQLKTFDYIRNHAQKRNWIWTFRDSRVSDR
jgi:REP element-mobilizing transposase RayT